MDANEVENEVPVRIDPEGHYTMRLRTIGLIILGTAIGVISWWSIKRDVLDHSKSLDAISSRLTTIESATFDARQAVIESKHDQAMLKLSIDYLVNDRRGPKPQTGAASP